MTSRKRASAFEMPAATPRPAREAASTPALTRKMEQLAQEEGYTVAHKPKPAKKPGRRRLKPARGNAVQLNISVLEETRERFWDIAETSDTALNGEDFLLELLDTYERVRGD